MNRPRNVLSLFAGLALLASASACTHALYAPERATWPYPFTLHNTQTVDMQVFRDDENLEIVNTTAVSYNDIDVWINQRYVRHLDALPAGQSVTLSLWEFSDQWGGVFNAGGLWRSYTPTPVRLVELQTNDSSPLVGLIAIRAEDAPDIKLLPGQ